MAKKKSVLKYYCDKEVPSFVLQCEAIEEEIYEEAEQLNGIAFHDEKVDFLSGNKAYLIFKPNNGNIKKGEEFLEERIYANSSISDENSIFYKAAINIGFDVAIIPNSSDFKTFKTGSKREINSGAFQRTHDTEYKLLATLTNKIKSHTKEKGFNGEIYGNVDLYTRKIPCLSCDYVLIQFHEVFPYISVNVFYEEN